MRAFRRRRLKTSGSTSSTRTTDGPFYGYEEPGHREEFWILDVQGTRLVLVQDASPGSPVEDLDERGAIFETIRIEP